MHFLQGRGFFRRLDLPVMQIHGMIIAPREGSHLAVRHPDEMKWNTGDIL